MNGQSRATSTTALRLSWSMFIPDDFSARRLRGPGLQLARNGDPAPRQQVEILQYRFDAPSDRRYACAASAFGRRVANAMGCRPMAAVFADLSGTACTPARQLLPDVAGNTCSPAEDPAGTAVALQATGGNSCWSLWRCSIRTPTCPPLPGEPAARLAPDPGTNNRVRACGFRRPRRPSRHIRGAPAGAVTPTPAWRRVARAARLGPGERPELAQPITGNARTQARCR